MEELLPDEWTDEDLSNLTDTWDSYEDPELVDQGGLIVEGIDKQHLPFAPRRLVSRAVLERPGQGQFRDALLEAYDGRCAVSGCGVPEVLEACHILPVKQQGSDDVSNGILLRADLHALFDKVLMAIDPYHMSVVISKALEETEYAQFTETQISLPPARSDWPDDDELQHHLEQFEWKEQSR